MHYKNKRRKASVALTTVIVLTAVLTLGAITLVQNTIATTRANKNLGDFAVSYLKSISCLEEGIWKLKLNIDYVGDYEVSIDDEVICEGTISNAGGDLRAIIISANNENTNFYREYTVDLSVDPYKVSY